MRAVNQYYRALNRVVVGPTLIPVPSGFNWTPPFNLYKNGSIYSSDFDPTVYDFSATATVTYYFNDVTGSDANSGLTPLLPKKNIYLVITSLNSSIPANGAVFILQTDYKDVFLAGGATLSVNFSLVIKSDVDGVKRKWTKAVTNSFITTVSAPVYRASRNQAVGPIDLTDLDAFGKPKRMIQVSTALLCASTPGSFFQETSAVQFHLFDGRAPDSNIMYFRSGPAFYSTTNTARNFYFQDIDFWAGCNNQFGAFDFSIIGNPAHVICANNCDFGYGEYGLKVWSGNNPSANPMRVYLKGCNIYGGAKDGANYHNTSAGVDADLPPNVYEQNCTFRFNGYTLPSGGGTPNNNGSSMHDGGKIIRLNSEYSYNQNRNIHEVDNNTQNWMIKCVAGYALNQISDNDSIDYNVGDNGGADVVESWMDGCSFVGNSLKNLRVNTGSTVRYKNIDFTGWDNQINGTLTTY